MAALRYRPAVRKLWPIEAGIPGQADVDLGAAYTADARPAPVDRPWVMVNMIASVDGSATDASGLSGGLSGPADRRVFSAIRGVADIVLAGAKTVRSERYGPPRVDRSLQDARVARGQARLPRVAVVTSSLDLDPDLPLFREATPGRPLLLTTAASLERAPSAAVRRLATVGEIVEAGDRDLEWSRALAWLRTEAAAGVVLAEGGPSTNAQLLAADLIDELCLTVSPAVVGGDGRRIVHGTGPTMPRRLALDRVLAEDDFLFLRYVRS